MENWTGRTGRHKSSFFFEYNKLYVKNWNFLFYCSNIAKSENAMLWRMLTRLETCIVYSCIWSVTLATFFLGSRISFHRIWFSRPIKCQILARMRISGWLPSHEKHDENCDTLTFLSCSWQRYKLNFQRCTAIEKKSRWFQSIPLSKYHYLCLTGHYMLLYFINNIWYKYTGITKRKDKYLMPMVD
jgi:hypothetical protein